MSTKLSVVFEGLTLICCRTFDKKSQLLSGCQVVSISNSYNKTLIEASVLL